MVGPVYNNVGWHFRTLGRVGVTMICYGDAVCVCVCVSGSMSNGYTYWTGHCRIVTGIFVLLINSKGIGDMDVFIRIMHIIVVMVYL